MLSASAKSSSSAEVASVGTRPARRPVGAGFVGPVAELSRRPGPCCWASTKAGTATVRSSSAASASVNLFFTTGKPLDHETWRTNDDGQHAPGGAPGLHDQPQ